MPTDFGRVWFTGRINFKSKFFVDRAEVIAKLDKWKLAQLSRVGAYARGAMKKQLRPALKGNRKSRTVLVRMPGYLRPDNWKGDFPKWRELTVLANGTVIDARNGKMVSKAIAIAARHEYQQLQKGKGEGKPPRSRTGKLKQHIYFSVDTSRDMAVIGPEPFPQQPSMPGRVSVPELLNKGGIEIIFGLPVQYGPRPYVETILGPAIKRLQENIHKRPLERHR